MERKTAKLELKELNEDGTFEGYAAVYNVEDLGGDIIDQGAFKRSISLRQGKVPILASHDPTQEIGVAEVQEDAKGIHVALGRLYLSADKDDEIPAARATYILMKRRQAAGMPLGMSIGYETVDHRFSGTVRHIKEAKLWEVSTCTFPMNPMAGVTAVKERPPMDKPATAAQQKAQTFAQVLQTRDVMEQRYEIDCAFWRSLWSILEDEEMAAEQKIAMAQVSLQQFSEALMGWVRQAVNVTQDDAVEYMSDNRYAPQLLSLVAEAKVAFAKHDTKAGAVFSARNRSTILSCIDQLQALLAIATAQEEDPAKSHASPPAAKDAPATLDPSDPEAVLHAEDADEELSEADMAQLLATIQSLGSIS